jgi:hypothetical protein
MFNYSSFKQHIFVSCMPQNVEIEPLRTNAAMYEEWSDKPNLLPKDCILITVKLFSTL